MSKRGAFGENNVARGAVDANSTLGFETAQISTSNLVEKSVRKIHVYKEIIK